MFNGARIEHCVAMSRGTLPDSTPGLPRGYRQAERAVVLVSYVSPVPARVLAGI